MRRLLLIIILLLVSKNAYPSNEKIPDSLTVYYRAFCSNFRFENTDIDKVKNFGSPENITIREKKTIKKIMNILRRLKTKKTNTQQSTDPIYLGCFSFYKGEERLLFLLQAFNQIRIDGKTYYYNDRLLDILFTSKRGCYY
jgi:hypothetical protein